MKNGRFRGNPKEVSDWLSTCPAQVIQKKPVALPAESQAGIFGERVDVPEDQGRAPIDKLLALMKTLRDPDRGCAWDIAQTPESIVPYTIEEAYEVADAVAAGRPDELREELGDLLLQVVFQAQIASEDGNFDFHDVVSTIVAKLIRRHPHVFDENGRIHDDAERPGDPDEVATMWRRIKDEERRAKAALGPVESGFLSGVARALPALARAGKLSQRAASFGFDWSNPRQVLAKVREEIAEVEAAMAENDRVAAGEEIGDLLFSIANLARHLAIDPEEALRRGNDKFQRRFDAMAAVLHRNGHTLEAADLDMMEAAWRVVKDAEQEVATNSVQLE